MRSEDNEDESTKNEEEAAAASPPLMNKETYEFQAETHRLMDILINSLYTNKEIFLRELISNANDALDKIRFLSLQDSTLLDGSGDDLEIRISLNKEEKTFTIQDSGIGMGKEDLIQNLGTVAKSGTSQFVEALQASGDMNLIGQFGVGFYSAFLVSDRVVVQSKSNSDPVQHIWESTANSSFLVYPDPAGNTLKRGTRITLHLKEDSQIYSEQEEVEKLIKRYSEFITFPIYLQKSRYEIKDSKDDSDNASEEGTTHKWWERINQQQAIWTRNPNDISDQEYKDFYKSLSKDTKDPFTWSHFKVEGEIEFKSIIYIPQDNPRDTEETYSKTNSIKLYVRKVLIADKFDDLLPRYLRFIHGVIDSDDLPLQVSREQIQQSKIIDVIKKKLVRKVLDIVRDLSSKPKELGDPSGETLFDEFWKKYGKNIKLGVIEDANHRNKLLKLLRVTTSKSLEESEDGLTTLDGYVKRMPDWQRSIYYIAGPDIETLKQSPFLEKTQSRGIEVILFTDPVDEYMMQNVPDYDGKKMVSITKEGIRFGDETEKDKKREKYYKKQFKPLQEFILKSLKGKVEKVVPSLKIGSSPALLTTSQFGYTANQERLAKSRAFGDANQLGFLRARKTMEINPVHPIIIKLKDRVAQGQSEEADDIIKALYDAASVASGFDIEEVQDFNKRMSKLLKAGLGLDSLDLFEEVDITTIEENEKKEDAAEEIDLDGSSSDEL